MKFQKGIFRVYNLYRLNLLLVTYNQSIVLLLWKDNSTYFSTNNTEIPHAKIKIS